MRTHVLAGIGLVVAGAVGTLWGLALTPLLFFFQRITVFIRSLLLRQANCPSELSGLPYQQDHAQQIGKLQMELEWLKKKSQLL